MEVYHRATKELIFQGADLRGANLFGADMQGANLFGADMQGG
jgi:uncharacterized protein YjbI with pentapeptide repeats